MPSSVYWDACVFIHRSQSTPDYKDVLKGLTDRAESDELQIVTSTWTITEISAPRDVLGRRLSEPEAQMILDFFDNKFIELIQLDSMIAGRAGEIVRSHNLKPKDAVHVASALAAEVPLMHTYDGKDDPRGLLYNTGRIGKPALRIEVPSGNSQLRMFP